MQVEFIQRDTGKRYRIPVTQVVIYTDDGCPCAVTYEHDSMVVHTDATHKDFDRTCAMLKIEAHERSC